MTRPPQRLEPPWEPSVNMLGWSGTRSGIHSLWGGSLFWGWWWGWRGKGVRLGQVKVWDQGGNWKDNFLAEMAHPALEHSHLWAASNAQEQQDGEQRQKWGILGCGDGFFWNLCDKACQTTSTGDLTLKLKPWSQLLWGGLYGLVPLVASLSTLHGNVCVFVKFKTPNNEALCGSFRPTPSKPRQGSKMTSLCYFLGLHRIRLTG